MAVAECIAQLRWLESIDPETFPADHLPSDWTIRSKAITAEFRNLNLANAKTTTIDAELFRICREGRNPLSDIGSQYADSRFNFRGLDGVFLTNSLYFGHQDLTAFVESFHKEDVLDDPEFAPEPHRIHKFHVKLDNVLVADSEAAINAIGLSFSVILNEWGYLNEIFTKNAKLKIEEFKKIEDVSLDIAQFRKRIIG